MTNLADKYPRINDMKNKAIKRMPHFAAEYLLSGTGYDRAMDHNQEVLKNIFLTPKTACHGLSSTFSYQYTPLTLH